MTATRGFAFPCLARGLGDVLHDPPDSSTVSAALHARASTDPRAVTAVARVRPSASRLLRGVAGSRPARGRATGCGPAGHGATTGPGPDHAALSPPAGQWPSGPRRPQHRVAQAALDVDLVASTAMGHKRLLSPCRPKAEWIGLRNDKAPDKPNAWGASKRASFWRSSPPMVPVDQASLDDCRNQAA
jgi:hypothetical protein